MSGLSVEADESADLLGKAASDLQSGIEIGNGKITGTLKYVTGYTGFSGDVSEQSGNYLAVDCSVPNETGVTITCELVGGTHGPVTLDDDGILVARITSTSQKLKVTAKKSGEADYTQTYALTDLTLTGAP